MTRLNDCWATEEDVRLLTATHRQPGTQDLAEPWLQGILLGIEAPLYLKQRVAGPLGHDFVGRIYEPRELFRSFSREADLKRTQV